MNTSRADIESKLIELQTSTHEQLNELKKIVAKRLHYSQCICYFTYALQLSHDAATESFCLGTFHIYNLGNQPIMNPLIHLVISEKAPFSLSGKFVSNATSLSPKLKNGWERTNARENQSEFHLMPIEVLSIEPGEKLSFSNFQLTWLPETFYTGSVTGTFFSDHHPDGLPALNSIDINGSMRKKERT